MQNIGKIAVLSLFVSLTIFHLAVAEDEMMTTMSSNSDMGSTGPSSESGNKGGGFMDKVKGKFKEVKDTVKSATKDVGDKIKGKYNQLKERLEGKNETSATMQSTTMNP